MRVITRAVYDMTDPRFWGEHPDEALVDAVMSASDAMALDFLIKE